MYIITAKTKKLCGSRLEPRAIEREMRKRERDCWILEQLKRVKEELRMQNEFAHKERKGTEKRLKS